MPIRDPVNKVISAGNKVLVKSTVSEGSQIFADENAEAKHASCMTLSVKSW